MPKLSAIPKMFTFSIDQNHPPLLAVLAATEAEAWAHLRTDKDAMQRATPAETFELGALGVPLLYAKPEYRNNQQEELPLSGSEVAHGHP